MALAASVNEPGWVLAKRIGAAFVTDGVSGQCLVERVQWRIAFPGNTIKISHLSGQTGLSETLPPLSGEASSTPGRAEDKEAT
jgi:hypothetical protein